MQRMQGLGIAALSLALTMPAAAETASQVFQQVSPSIVVVVAYDAAGKPAELGSGVILPNRTVATNCHVLKDGTQYRVRYGDKVYPARLDKSDWDRDVCSLSVPDLPAPPVVLGNTKTLQVGAPVYAIGAPEGLQLTLSEGIVSSLRPVGGGSYIQTTAAISPGSSGGGLFDDQGHLLGLTSFFMSQGQQLNFALPVEWIESLPQRSTQRIAPRTSEVDWLNQAAALEKEKDWGDLLRLSEEWLRARPESALAWAILGESYDGTGQHSQAIAALRHASQINPQDAESWFDLGVAYNHAGQRSQSIDAYRQALRVNPQNVDAWSNLGGAYDDAGEHSHALDAYHQALQIKPQDAKVWHDLGVVYTHAGQYSQAVDTFRQALQINPQVAEVWDSLGVAYADEGQYSQAIDAHRRALQIKPQDADIWYNLGTAYGQAGQLSQSVSALRQALQFNPRFAEAWANLGVTYAKTSHFPQAIDALRQALRINPQDANTWYLLGVIYNAAGQNAQAIAVYQHLKTLSPELAQKLFDVIVPK